MRWPVRRPRKPGAAPLALVLPAEHVQRLRLQPPPPGQRQPSNRFQVCSADIHAGAAVSREWVRSLMIRRYAGMCSSSYQAGLIRFDHACPETVTDPVKSRTRLHGADKGRVKERGRDVFAVRRRGDRRGLYAPEAVRRRVPRAPRGAGGADRVGPPLTHAERAVAGGIGVIGSR